jgi:hypothetical protein
LLCFFEKSLFIDLRKNVTTLSILLTRTVSETLQKKLFFSLKIIKTMTRATIIKVRLIVIVYNFFGVIEGNDE